MLMIKIIYSINVFLKELGIIGIIKVPFNAYNFMYLLYNLLMTENILTFLV